MCAYVETANQSSIKHHPSPLSLSQKIVQHEEPFLVSVASTTAMVLPPPDLLAFASSDGGTDETATGFEAVSAEAACFFGEEDEAAAACWGAEDAGAADCFGAAAGGWVAAAAAALAGAF